IHRSALAGVPVMTPARRAFAVLAKAGAIWFVASEPSPATAKLIMRFSCAPAAPTSPETFEKRAAASAAAAPAACPRNRRRDRCAPGASVIELLDGVLLAGRERPRIALVVNAVQREEPLAVDLGELVIPRAEQHPLDLVAALIVVKLDPIRQRGRLVAFDLDDLIRDQGPHGRRPVLAVRRLRGRRAARKVVSAARHELAYRLASLDEPTRPVEHAVFRENGRIAVRIQVVHRHDVARLAVDDG